MSTEFNFTVIDANEPVETQQAVVRQLVSQRVDLSGYKRRKPLPPPPSVPRVRRGKVSVEEETVE
jgi:hypothetical protein